MPVFSAKNFCDGLEMKFASPSDEIQQAGAPETAAKSLRIILILLSVSDSKRANKSCISLSPLPHGVKPQVKARHGMNSPAFTLHTMFD